MDNYLTLSEAVNSLQQQGYLYNFNIQRNVLRCSEQSIELKPEDFEIDKVFRFEGQSDPEMRVLCTRSHRQRITSKDCW